MIRSMTLQAPKQNFVACLELDWEGAFVLLLLGEAACYLALQSVLYLNLSNFFRLLQNLALAQLPNLVHPSD